MCCTGTRGVSRGSAAKRSRNWPGSASTTTRSSNAGTCTAHQKRLHAVARALRLNEAERTHLFDLARARAGAGAAASPDVLRPTVQRTLDAFTGGMALVRNRRWDYLAANALGRAVYAEIFDGRTGAPNHVRYVFLDPRARRFFDDWPVVAHDTARILRAEAGRDPLDPGPAALIDQMPKSAQTSAPSGNSTTSDSQPPAATASDMSRSGRSTSCSSRRSCAPTQV